MDTSSTLFNVVPENVSKITIRNLMYAGANSRIWSHLQPWFCMNQGSTDTGTQNTTCNGHVQVGYNSRDYQTVFAQITDMAERGIEGVAIDWYGKPYDTPTEACPDGWEHCVENETTKEWSSQLHERCVNGTCTFKFSIMEDGGAFRSFCDVRTNPPRYQANGYSTVTACIESRLLRDLDYANGMFWWTLGYAKAHGHPEVFVFINEDADAGWNGAGSQNIADWQTIWTTVRNHAYFPNNGSPVFYFRNTGGFSHAPFSDGAYAWVNNDCSLFNPCSNDPWGKSYLDYFYSTSLNYSNLMTFGAAWKGFDDRLASWGANRLIDQKCGLTWLDTMRHANWDPSQATYNGPNAYYSIFRQLPAMAMVTWNDYEEGSEIETGIDNCLSLTTVFVANSANGTSKVTWFPNFTSPGNEGTVDHYQVWWEDWNGQLQNIANVAAGNAYNVDVTSLSSDHNKYYVRAVGKASIKNTTEPMLFLQRIQP